jgi:hypothetical protein
MPNSRLIHINDRKRHKGQSFDAPIIAQFPERSGFKL